MTEIAACGGVLIPVSMRGMSMASSTLGHRPADQQAAEKYAENDRGDGRALDPAVGDHQLPRRQQLGEDAVLGGRVRGRAEADQRVRGERMQA